MKKISFFTTISLLLFIQCKKDKDPFLITNNEIGHLTKEIKISQLDSIFAQDSIVKLDSKNSFITQSNQIEIYEKGGTKLLQINTKEKENAEPKITNIQVFDARYKTDKGLTLKSTFKDLKENYTISSIQNGIQSLVVSLAENDVYITIDKSFLPEELKNEFGATVTADDIPDNATFKFLMIGWEAE